MKHIIILGDGMADWPVKALGGKTLLQAAATPYMDKLARMGRVGRLVTVAEGFHPGSEVANMSVLGYNLPKVYEGAVHWRRRVSVWTCSRVRWRCAATLSVSRETISRIILPGTLLQRKRMCW